MAGDNGGPGKPGTAELYVQRPAGAGNPEGKPGQEAWAVYRRNLDGSEPRYYLSNAAEDTPLETLAYVGGSRWPIETEFETEKGLAWTNTRPVLVRPHHIAMCLLGVPAGPAAGLGGKRCPDHPSPGVPGGAGNVPPGTVRTCCCWRIRSYATSGRAAPTSTVKAGWSHHLPRRCHLLAARLGLTNWRCRSAGITLRKFLRGAVSHCRKIPLAMAPRLPVVPGGPLPLTLPDIPAPYRNSSAGCGQRRSAATPGSPSPDPAAGTAGSHGPA